MKYVNEVGYRCWCACIQLLSYIPIFQFVGNLTMCFIYSTYYLMCKHEFDVVVTEFINVSMN